MSINKLLFALAFILALLACSDNQASGSTSETQNALIILVDSKPVLTRANSQDTLRRWEFDIPQSDSVWTLQLQGALHNADSISAWKAHIGNKALAFEEKTLFALSKYQGEIIKNKSFESADSNYIEISLKLINATNTYGFKSKMAAVKTFDTLVAGLGTLWQSRTLEYHTQFFYASCSGTTAPSSAISCTQEVSQCDEKMPIMCTTNQKVERPIYNVDLNISIEGQAPEWSQGWSGYEFAVGSSYKGSQLQSKAIGDSICQKKFGSFSQWASDSLSKYISGMSDVKYTGTNFSDSFLKQTGGWGFYGYWKDSGPNFGTPLWVHRNKPMANCWWE